MFCIQVMFLKNSIRCFRKGNVFRNSIRWKTGNASQKSNRCFCTGNVSQKSDVFCTGKYSQKSKDVFLKI